VSYYHHHRLWNGYVGTFDDFVEAFLSDVREYFRSSTFLTRNISVRICKGIGEFHTL